MDYVEAMVINKVNKLMKMYYDENDFRKVIKQEFKKYEKKNNYYNNLDTYKSKLEKVTMEIDSIYNDKLNGLLLSEDFKRIYERKKQEKITLQEKMDTLNSHIINHSLNENLFTNTMISNFSYITINREMLINLIDKIELDENKNIYIKFKFKNPSI